MTIEEVRAIKEAMSLETVGMGANELHEFYSRGAAEIQARIDALRAESTPERETA